MTKVQWHWIKDGDYPQDEQDVWCVSKCLGILTQYRLTFSNNLFKVNEYDFARYRNVIHLGFYDYDSEWGYYEVKDVVCWCELPDLPEQLRETNHD